MLHYLSCMHACRCEEPTSDLNLYILNISDVFNMSWTNISTSMTAPMTTLPVAVYGTLPTIPQHAALTPVHLAVPLFLCDQHRYYAAAAVDNSRILAFGGYDLFTVQDWSFFIDSSTGHMRFDCTPHMSSTAPKLQPSLNFVFLLSPLHQLDKQLGVTGAITDVDIPIISEQHWKVCAATHGACVTLGCLAQYPHAPMVLRRFMAVGGGCTAPRLTTIDLLCGNGDL